MSLAAYAIPEKIFFKIGEVCDLVGVQPARFAVLGNGISDALAAKKPRRQRTYRRRDVEIALRIKELLYEDLFTIAGAKKKLSAELREQTKLKVVPNNEPPRVEQKSEPEFQPPASTPLQKSSFAPPPITVRSFPAHTVIEPEEDADVDFAADEFDADETSSEKKAALVNLKKQLGELKQILDRVEEPPRRAW